MKSKAKTVTQYLAGLPADRRATIKRVRQVIKRHLPAGYREAVHFGMIGYAIPLSRYPDTYNGQPLLYLGLASQKHRCTIYMMGVYSDPAQLAFLKAAFKNADLKLTMGKSCIHFNGPEDLPLVAIGKLVAWTPVKEYIARYEATRGKR